MKGNKVLIRLITLAIATIMCLVIVQTVSATDPDTVAVWHFDEGIGSTAADATGNGNDGTLSGGKFGNALYFDGDNDYVEVAESPSLDISGTSITLEAWINAKEFPPGRDIVIAKVHAYSLQVAEGGKVRAYIGPLKMYQTSSVVLSTDIWHHIASTYDGAYVRIFVDGDLKLEVLRTGNQAQYVSDIQLGGYPSGDFKGIVDEIRISNTTRYVSSFTTLAAPFSDDTYTMALWHFDESTGTTAEDSSSNGNHGTIYGAIWAGPVWVDGYFGKALDFDGVDDYVKVPDDISLDITGDITLEAWVKVEEFSTSEGWHLYVISKDSVGQRSYGLGIGDSRSGTKKPAFVIFPSSGLPRVVWGNMDLIVGNWYHLAGTYDSALGETKIYIDGVDVTLSGTSSTIFSGSANLRIGAREYSGHQCFFNGIIDEVRIWDRALTATEIKQHKCLVGEWDFNEGTGSNAYDSSGFENHGTLYNMEPGDWVTGKTGTALHFDDVDDYVAITNADSLEPEHITVEAWVKHDGSPGTYEYVLSKYHPEYHGSRSSYGLYTGGSGGLYFYIGHSTAPSYTLSPEIPSSNIWDGNWHHVAGTYDGSNLKLYLDGVQVNGDVSSTTDIAYNENGDLYFGNYVAGTARFQYSGIADEIRIWNRALVPVVFSQIGLEECAIGTVVTVDDPIYLEYTDLPYVMMVPIGAEVYYDYIDEILCDGNTEKKFLLDSGDDTGTITITGPTPVTGVYKTQYYLTVEVSPGSVSPKPSGEGWYDEGTSVDLTASEITGHTLLYWEVDSTKQPEGQETVSVTMDQAHTADAHYFEWVTVSGTKYEDVDGEETNLVPIENWPIYLEFCDDFEADTVGGSAANWSPENGIWTVVDDGGSNAYQQSQLLSGRVSYATIPGYDFTDGIFEVKVKGSNSGQHIIWRSQGGIGSDYYFFGWHFGNNNIRWGKFESDSATIIDSVTNYLLPNIYYTLKVVAEGNNFDMYVDDVLIFSVTDSTFSSGSVGFHCADVTYYDDVCIYQKTSTDSNGDYSFTVKEPGAYYLKEELPDKWTQTYPNDVIGYESEDMIADGYMITIAEADGGIPIIGKNFWNFEWITISGHKYEDYESGFPMDHPLSGWTIELWEDGAYVALGTTDVDGFYEIPITYPGSYEVKEYLPSGWTETSPAHYHGVGTVVPGEAITVVSGQDVTGQDFWNFKWATISGTKYFDYDDSQPTDYPIKGWTIELDDGSTYTTTTDSNGEYSFTVKDPGTYVITENLLAGWTKTAPGTPYIGDPSLDTTITVYDDVVVNSGDEISGKDIWNFEWLTVSGTKFFDADGNRERHTNEPGLTNWKIYLDGANMKLTDGNGDYSYIIKEPGIYTVSEELKLGCWLQTYPEEPGTHTVDTSTHLWDITGTYEITFDFDGLTKDYVHMMLVTQEDGTFSGTGYYTTDPAYTWDVTGTITGINVDFHLVYTGSNAGYYLDCSAIINSDGSMTGVMSNAGQQSGTWTTTSGSATRITEITDLDFGNWLGKSWISDSSFCCFDMDDEGDRQFRVIFTPDVTGDPNLYKVSATNPGQFYYHVFANGPLGTTDIFEITLPEGFETQGGNPVHVYSGLNTADSGCIIPEGDISYMFDIDWESDPITVTPKESITGFVYINVHCDYALKQTGGYEPQLHEDSYGIWRAHAISEEYEIDDLTDYTFSVSGAVTDSQTMQNRNVFKKIRGIAGCIDGASEGEIVTIVGPDDWLEEVLVEVDADGFYGYSFHHKGKPFVYTVIYGSTEKTVELKAGKFAEVNFP